MNVSKKAFDRSSKLKDPTEVTTAVGYAYEAMGDLYLKFEDFETAKYYYEKCPEMVYDDQENKTRFKVALFMAMKNFDSALVYHRKYSQNKIAEWRLITPDSVLLKEFDPDLAIAFFWIYAMPYGVFHKRL